MGSRGFTLEKAPPKWDTAGYIGGVKVLRPRKSGKRKRDNINLPQFSNTPGTTYIALNDDGTFKQLRVFGADRSPWYDIEFGAHRSEAKYLHAHLWTNGERIKEPDRLDRRHPLYQRHKMAIEAGSGHG